jgi:hypothetical protein
VEQTGQEQSAGGADGADGRHRLLTQYRGRMELEGRGRTGSGQGAGVGDTQMRGQRASDQASLLARFGERVWGACWPGETPLRNCMAVAKARNVGARRACQASSVKRQAAGVRQQAASVERRASSIEAAGRARAERPSRQTRAFGAGVDGVGVNGANARAVSVSSTSCSARRRLWGHGHPERLFGAKIWVRNGQDPSAAMRTTPPEWLPGGRRRRTGLAVVAQRRRHAREEAHVHMCRRARNQHVESASLAGLTSPTPDEPDEPDER